MANGMNPNDATDAKNLGPDGYTQLEEYLNSFAGPHAVVISNSILNVDLWQYTVQIYQECHSRVLGLRRDQRHRHALGRWSHRPVHADRRFRRHGRLQLHGRRRHRRRADGCRECGRLVPPSPNHPADSDQRVDRHGGQHHPDQSRVGERRHQRVECPDQRSPDELGLLANHFGGQHRDQLFRYGPDAEFDVLLPGCAPTTAAALPAIPAPPQATTLSHSFFDLARRWRGEQLGCSEQRPTRSDGVATMVFSNAAAVTFDDTGSASPR